MKAKLATTIAILAMGAGVRAERVSLPDAGVSVWLPSGWTVQHVSITDSTRLYLLQDTVIDDVHLRPRHSGSILVQTCSGVAGSASARDWVDAEAEAWAMSIRYASIVGVLQFNDTTYWAGLYAREVLGDFQDAPDDSTQTLFARISAHGDVGWEAWIQADKSDADTALPTYASVIDSVQPDTTLSSLPFTAVLPRSSTPRMDPSIRPLGGVLRIASSERPDLAVFGLDGRRVAGELRRESEGTWTWSPATGTRPFPVVARLRSDGGIRSARMVLAP